MACLNTLTHAIRSASAAKFDIRHNETDRTITQSGLAKPGCDRYITDSPILERPSMQPAQRGPLSMSSSPSAVARVLPFVPSPSLTMSLEDRIEQLRTIDPEGAAMIERIISALCSKVDHGPSR